MANLSGVLQPSDQDAITFTIAATTASAVKTFWPNAILLVSVAQTSSAAAGVTATFGQVNASPLGGIGHAPTTPSATNGFFINANAPAQVIWLGPNRDSLQFFNVSGANVATVSIQPMQP